MSGEQEKEVQPQETKVEAKEMQPEETKVEAKEMQPEETKVEAKEEHANSSGDDQDHGHDHDHDHDHDQDHDHDDLTKKGSKGEKKFKKAMSKMGLKQFGGVNRVTIKRGKNFIISIDDPDVWKSPGNQSAYVVFGKPNLDGLQTGQTEMSQFSNPINVQGPKEEENTETPAVQKKEQPAKTEQNPVQNLSEEGLDPENIKMIMQYCKCSKAQAIKALRQSKDDSISAIMNITK